MRPRFFPTALLAMIAIPGYAQGPPTIVWQNSYGGSWDDQCYAIVRSDDGGYIVAGATKSNDFDIIGHHGSPNSDDMLVLKYDAQGHLLWQKSLGGTGGEVAFDMVPAPNGGCVIAASASSTNGDVVGVFGGSDFWLVGLDGSGGIAWQRVLGGSSSDWGILMDTTSDGGMVLCGQTSSSDGDISGNHGASDLWVAKLDAAGTIQWSHCYGGSQSEYVSGIVQNTAGGYYVVGQTKSNDGDVSGNHGGLFDAWVFCLDSAGTLRWQRTMGGSSSDWFFGLAEDHQGGVICAGATASTDGDVPGNLGGGDLWVVDLDSTGVVQWNRNYGYVSNDGARCIRQAPDGGYYVAGSTYGPTGYEPGLWMLELDSAGHVAWNKRIGGSNTSEAIDMVIDDDGDLVVTGWSAAGDGDVSDNHGITDAWTVKLTLRYATLTGKAFVDGNSNGAQDNGEAGLQGHAIVDLDDGLPYYTDHLGRFRVTAVDTGTTTIAPEPAPYYSFAPPSHAAVLPELLQQVDSLNDFAMQADGLVTDLGVTSTPVGVFRHLWQTHYRITYKDLGTTSVADPVLRFIVDPGLTYESASTPPTAINGDTLIWQLPALAPYEEGSILVFVSVPLSTPLGTELFSTALIGPEDGDADLSNNSATWPVFAVQSADPNDMLVDREEVQLAELEPLPPFLDYIIRFQNTGTDTAFQVRIENTVPVNADRSSFELVCSSHPVDVEYLPYVDRFKFTFPGILLPDSGVNEAASHGFLRYRMRPKNALLVGDSVLNAAAIYFDHNLPVRTNTAWTVVENSVGLDARPITSVRLLPNPSSGLCRVDAGNARHGAITVYDAFGRPVARMPYTGACWLDLTGEAPGVYIVRLELDEGSFAGRLVITR